MITYIFPSEASKYNMKWGNEMEKVAIFINEKSYQQIKKEMCKKDDYFTVEELENIGKKIGVILA